MDLGRTGSSTVVGTLEGTEEELAADTGWMVAAADTVGMVAAADTGWMVAAIGSTVGVVAVGSTVRLVDFPILEPADSRMDYYYLEIKEQDC